MKYNQHFTRFTTTRALYDRETDTQFSKGDFISVRSAQGVSPHQGKLIYIGTKNILLALEPRCEDKDGYSTQSVERLSMNYFVSVERIEPLWSEVSL